MADNILKDIGTIKMTKGEWEEIQKSISSWANLHRWIQQGVNQRELLKAMHIELNTKKRYAIVKRLHQAYCKLRNKADFQLIEGLID